MLHDQRELQRASRELHVFGVGRDHVSGSAYAPVVANALHGLTRWFVEGRSRARECQPEPLQRLHYLDAGPIFFPRAIAQVEKDIEAAARKFAYLAHGSG